MRSIALGSERVGLELADVVQQGAGDGDVAVHAREGGGDQPDGLGDAERVLEQAVPVGLVVALGGRGVAEAIPGVQEDRVQQVAQVGVLHGGDQRVQVRLHLLGRARRAVVELGRVVLALGGRADGLHLELAAVARVLRQRPANVHGAARAQPVGEVGDVVPDHGREQAGAVAHHQAQVLAAVAAGADLHLAHEQHSLDDLTLGELAHLHAGECRAGPGQKDEERRETRRRRGAGVR